jgi:DNA-binding NtrC family response regulator
MNKSLPSYLMMARQPSDEFALVREIRAHDAETPIVLLADGGSIEDAVKAIQQEGVYNYLEKPIDPNKLKLVLDGAVELALARRENELLRRQLQDRGRSAILSVILIQ